jgi:hypothetical protein
MFRHRRCGFVVFGLSVQDMPLTLSDSSSVVGGLREISERESHPITERFEKGIRKD